MILSEKFVKMEFFICYNIYSSNEDVCLNQVSLLMRYVPSKMDAPDNEMLNV